MLSLIYSWIKKYTSCEDSKDIFDIFYLYHATHIVFLLARFNFIAYIYYLYIALLLMERVNIEYGPYKDKINHLQN